MYAGLTAKSNPDTGETNQHALLGGGAQMASSKIGNGEWRNGEWGTGNGESLKGGISKMGNL